LGATIVLFFLYTECKQPIHRVERPAVITRAAGRLEPPDQKMPYIQVWAWLP